MFNALLPEQASTRKVLLIILGVALAIHFISDIGVYALRPGSISTTPDPLDYRLAALNLLHHGTFSISPYELHVHELLRTPVYPAIVAVGYVVDGETGLAVILLQSLLLVVMGWMLFRLLEAFRVPDNLNLVLVALYLVEPLQWLYTLQTMTETLASFLVLALITAALVGRGINDCSRAALYGVGLGLAVLVKPSVMMWVPFLLLLVLCAAGEWRVRFFRIGIAVLLFLMTLCPWMIRNYNLTGHAVVSSSNAYAFVMFTTIPTTAPPLYYTPLATVSYNDHTNQVWYAYTTAAYPMLVAANHSILSHLDYRSFVMRQITWAPIVWFGYIRTDHQEGYGHEYNLIADFILKQNPARDKILAVIDTTTWTLLLVLTALGSFLLLKDSFLRWRFLPLLAILLATVFINFCASWVRMLLPVYPVICVATGVGVAFLIRKIFLLKP